MAGPTAAIVNRCRHSPLKLEWKGGTAERSIEAGCHADQEAVGLKEGDIVTGCPCSRRGAADSNLRDSDIKVVQDSSKISHLFEQLLA